MVKRKPRRTVVPSQSQIFQGARYDRNSSSELYHLFLTASWRAFFATVLGLYVLSNCLFAFLYMAMGHVIENAHPGSFGDAFFFSVQTMATIGYGKMTPVGTAANLVVAFEALYGIVFSAVMTGVVLTRFTRPSSGVRFTKIAVVHNHDGVPTLKIRLANERNHSHVVEANVRMMLVRDAVNAEGQRYRRPEKLKVVRSENPVFALSWTVMHQITPDSPLYCSPEEGGMQTMLQRMREHDWYVLIIFNGYHETFASEVHTRMSYYPNQILLDTDFADVLSRNEDGDVVLDLQYFDHLKTLDGQRFTHDPSGAITQSAAPKQS